MAFVSAYRCDRATHYLMWGLIRGNEQGWAIRSGDEVVATLDGYPVSQPPRTERAAVPWAASVTGIAADRWIQQPRRSGAFHAHQGDEPCARPE